MHLNQQKNCLKEKKIDVLPWPSRSPDLNPTKDQLGYLSLQVYENNKQYRYESEMAIMKKWDYVPKSFL